MYQEVAFDPQCLSEYHYYGILKERFGFEAGRYVIAPVKDWIKEAFKAAKASETLKPVKKKSILHFLNKLQKKKNNQLIILPKYRADIQANTWDEWCTQQIALSPFKSVISESFSDSINFDDIIESNASWVLSPTVQIKKKAYEIISVIEPLISFGGNITIVDQFFCLASNPVLDTMLAVIQNQRSMNTIRLVTSVNVNNPVNVFNNCYLSKYLNLPKFELIVAPEKFFHDRYVITNLGAIKSGHGFSEGVEQGSQSDSLSINLCGKKEAERTLEWVNTIIKDGKAKIINLHNG